jgi:hypothetical protein
MLNNIDLTRKYINTAEASKLSGLSNVHITRLLRGSILEGFQLGRDWFVYADSLEMYLATPHKPGPKGPIKKRASTSMSAGDGNNQQ